MTQEHRKSILQMAQGAIMERVDYEMSRVLDGQHLGPEHQRHSEAEADGDTDLYA